jgi:hypothetical protein
MNTEAITHKSGLISQESRDMAKLASKTKKKTSTGQSTSIYFNLLLLYHCFRSTIFSFAQYIINVCLFLVSGEIWSTFKFT